MDGSRIDEIHALTDRFLRPFWVVSTVLSTPTNLRQQECPPATPTGPLFCRLEGSAVRSTADERCDQVPGREKLDPQCAVMRRNRSLRSVMAGTAARLADMPVKMRPVPGGYSEEVMSVRY